MTPKLFLRIAFGLILFHLLGHTVGHFTWKDTEDPVLRELIQKMQSHSFDFMGTPQTLAGHHEGYSLMLGLTLIMLAVITWMFSTRISDTPQFKAVVLAIGIFFVVFGIVETIYFFPLPGVTSILAGTAYLMAANRAKP